MRPSCLATALLLVGITGCGGDAEPTRVAPGAPAPAFVLPALDGTTFDSRALAGRRVVMNFWATWCQPCRRELPELAALAAAGEVEVVGIALDEEGADTVRPFVDRHAVPYTVLLGDEAVFRRFAGFTVPYTLALDSTGRVVAVYRGPTSRAAIERDFATAEGSP